LILRDASTLLRNLEGDTRENSVEKNEEERVQVRLGGSKSEILLF